MVRRLSVDTTFLIDLQRERRQHSKGPAHTLLERNPEVELHLSAVALGEFSEGFEDQNHPVLRTVRHLHVILPTDEATAEIYGQMTRVLRGDGQLLGANDLWIAATSLQHSLPLLSADIGHFGRIRDLELIPYR